MAGTVTQTRSSNYFGRVAECIVSLACVSDASAGTIPNETVNIGKDWELKEVININPAADQPTTAYRIKIVDTNGVKAYFSPTDRSITASAVESSGGHEHIGWYPRIDGAVTVSFRDSGDTGAANVGNSKSFTVKLRFEKKQGI